MPAPELFHLVYQSTATSLFNETDLQTLLVQSRNWNTSHGLTGVLLYSHGEIMQVLEGSREEVYYIFNRIERDYRHVGVNKLSDGYITERNFSQWSMGFKAVDPNDFTHLKGYLNLARNTSLDDISTGSDPSLHDLLATFVTHNQVRF